MMKSFGMAHFTFAGIRLTKYAGLSVFLHTREVQFCRFGPIPTFLLTLCKNFTLEEVQLFIGRSLFW